jgi:hypothetical protein
VRAWLCMGVVHAVWFEIECDDQFQVMPTAGSSKALDPSGCARVVVHGHAWVYTYVVCMGVLPAFLCVPCLVCLCMYVVDSIQDRGLVGPHGLCVVVWCVITVGPRSRGSTWFGPSRPRAGL